MYLQENHFLLQVLGKIKSCSTLGIAVYWSFFQCYQSSTVYIFVWNEKYCLLPKLNCILKSQKYIHLHCTCKLQILRSRFPKDRVCARDQYKTSNWSDF